MSASQAGLFSLQEFSDIGVLLVGGRVYTYFFGTTAQKTAYTDQAGTVPHTYTADGLGGQYIALNARGELPAPLYLTAGSYDIALKRADGSSVWTRRADPCADASTSVLTSLANTSDVTQGDALIGVLASLTGAVARTQHQKNMDFVHGRDFGLVADGVTDDSAAITRINAAIAAGRAMWMPAATWVTSVGLVIPYGGRVIGENAYTCMHKYTGSGDAVYIGGPGNTTIISYGFLANMRIAVTSRASTVKGIHLDNAVDFGLDNVVSIGSGSPNSSTPADRVLYGDGIYASNNSIIGYMNHVTSKLWMNGITLETLSGSPSYWTAAITIGGQCDIQSNMVGIKIGDPSVAYASGVGVALRDVCVQGNYTVGMQNYSGESLTIDNCYFEGNANHDIVIGGGAASPVMNRIINCPMTSEDIGTTPYGTFPYLSKVQVLQGSFNQLHMNDLSISTSIPLVQISSAAVQTTLKHNRLNSTIGAQLRIDDQSTSTITADNYPEKPVFAAVAITRDMATASGTVSYTGFGFRPNRISVTGAVDSASPHFVGSAGIGIGLQQRCVSTDSAGLNYSSGNCIRLIQSSGNEQVGNITSFDADGITVAWTRVGSPTSNTLGCNIEAER